MSVTVLMSSYNGARYIRNQIDSILCQSYKDCVLYVRDDGSNDATKEILQQYAQANLLKWYPGTNLGVGGSFFDLVINAPDSDFYAFADQDDIWKKEKIKRAISLLQAHDQRELLLYCAQTMPVDDQLNPMPLPKRNISNEMISLAYSLLICPAPGCTFVFNKPVLEEFKKFNPEHVDIHDWTLLRIVKALGGIVIADNMPLMLYRQHDNNAVGYQKDTLALSFSKIKRVVLKKNPKSINIRSIMASNIYRVYGAKISPQNSEIINTIANINGSFFNILKFMFYNSYTLPSLKEKLIFSIMAIIGKL